MKGQFGLIGFPLGHSFSKKYFTEKFATQGLNNTYELFELEDITNFSALLETNNFNGLNVTIPHKQSIIPFLNKLDHSANQVGAVNVIKFEKGVLIGYNTDYPAFRKTLKEWIDISTIKALVLGTGGASKAVIAALQDLGINYQQVSRTKSTTIISYNELLNSKTILDDYKLIINTTPLGMSPNTNLAPELPYSLLTSSHFLYDLVYNPEETLFLKKGKDKGCYIKNGLDMLHLQAELAWDIWNA